MSIACRIVEGGQPVDVSGEGRTPSEVTQQVSHAAAWGGAHEHDHVLKAALVQPPSQTYMYHAHTEK